MALSINMLLFMAGVGILQSLFLACLIYFHPNSDRSVNKFLALYVFWLSVPMFTPLLQQFITWQPLIMVEPFLLLPGPFLYLYVRSFKETINFQKAWVHFILFALYLIIDYSLFVSWSNRFPPGPTVPVEVLHDPLSILRVTVRIAQLFTYPLLARNALNSYQRSINHLFSETSKIDLAWVKWLINGFMMLTFIMLALYFVLLRDPENFRLIILINTAMVTPYIYIVTFKGVTQPTLWQAKSGLSKEKAQEELHEAEIIEQVSENEKEKGEKPVLNPERRQDIVARTLVAMEEGKLFLKTELTLQDIADQLNIPAYQVSQAINEGLKKTFYDLVNGYRVEEAKRLLVDPKRRNNKMLAVAFDAGFNSKTTFNTVFKKFTGFTPTDFKEQHQLSVAAV